MRGVNYGRWLFQVIAWDGLLPAAVVLAPWGIQWVFPNRPGMIEIAGVTIPIVAFFVRVAAGRRHISSNHCGGILRCLQYIVFGLACLVLLLVDAFVILSHIVPQGVAANEEDLMILAWLLSLYLLAMTFALFPGRQPRDTAELEMGFIE